MTVREFWPIEPLFPRVPEEDRRAFESVYICRFWRAGKRRLVKNGETKCSARAENREGPTNGKNEPPRAAEGGRGGEARRLRNRNDENADSQLLQT